MNSNPILRKLTIMNSFARTAIFASALSASALSSALTTYSFQPSSKDLDDLDHYYAYQWGLDFKVPTGEEIVGAQIKIKNIYNWDSNANILYASLLDNPGSGVKTFYDNQGGGDYFAGKGKSIGTWTDTVGGKARNFDLTFDLGKAGLLKDLNKFAADGKFGIGLDPDCHFYNEGVTLHIQTAPVPEPATMATLAIGGLALLRKRKKA